MNGVIGWGLNDREEAEESVKACYTCLHPSGKFIIGWNDIPERCPFKIDDLLSLKKFRRWEFPPFKTWRFLIKNYRLTITTSTRNRTVVIIEN
jgi:hypothetical protein